MKSFYYFLFSALYIFLCLAIMLGFAFLIEKAPYDFLKYVIIGVAALFIVILIVIYNKVERNFYHTAVDAVRYRKSILNMRTLTDGIFIGIIVLVGYAIWYLIRY